MPRAGPTPACLRNRLAILVVDEMTDRARPSTKEDMTSGDGTRQRDHSR
jgi:hypothetical protein